MGRKAGKITRFKVICKTLMKLDPEDPDLRRKVSHLKTLAMDVMNDTQEDHRVVSAEWFANKMKPKITEARRAGCKSLRSIADYLNERKVRTKKGNQWSPMTISLLLDRIADLER
jgi:hypothetical protein